MKTAKILLCLLLAGMLLLAGCGAPKQDNQPNDDASSPNENADPDKEDPNMPNDPDTPNNPDDNKVQTKDLRVLLSSDIHCTDLLEWYNVDFRSRMQHWVDSVLAEHAADPLDLLIINGDISLDYWINGGSVLEKGEGTAKIFITEYLSQLPKELPVYVMPGNHEQYSDEDWFALTGNHRQGAIALGGRLFIMLDNFGAQLDPNYHHDGAYTKSDVTYIKSMMEEYPDHDVYLVAHYFNTDAESSEFKKLVEGNDRIKALFAGHTHKTALIEYAGKVIAQTGNFAYFKDSAKESFWGFRELIITDENAYSQYIIADSNATVDGVNRHFNRTILSQVCYYGTAPEIPVDENDPLAKYNTLYDKIVQDSIDGDVGMKESNRVQLIFDDSVNTKWCVRPTSADGSVTVTWQMSEAVRIDAYAISTANDHLSRNPKAWTLYGKNSADGEWEIISDITDGNLPQELFTVSDVFTVENPKAYQYYKLTVTDNFNNRDLYQFSELILLQKK